MIKENILIINICKEKLHYYEFVRPIEDILRNLKKENKINYFVKHYEDLEEGDLMKSSKVIICGTSLADNEFVEDINKFRWILDFNKPILGICGGMEIIGLVFKGKLKRKTEIGFYFEDFKKDFLGLIGKREVYHLHNYYVDFSKLKEFEVYCFSDGGINKVSQAVKHKEKPIYGVLFHPEVRQKDLIINFVGHDGFSNVILRKFKNPGNVKKTTNRIKKNPLKKSYSLDKKLLKSGWRSWEKSNKITFLY